MNKTVVIAVFAGLFVFMILDFIFSFGNVIKAIFYGGFFLVGIIIYFLNNDLNFKRKD